jgi:hypothetical protein
VFAPFRNFDSKTKNLLISTSTWVVGKCIYNNSMSNSVTYKGNCNTKIGRSNPV